MKMIVRCVQVLTLLGCLTSGVVAQRRAYVRALDVQPLVNELRNACASVAVDADTRNLDLVFSLMTSHFGIDPGHGEALRQIATDTVQRFSSIGDRVAIAAWEMDLWSLSPPIQLNEGTPEERASHVRALLPTAPRENSRGGHDTERSLCSLWRETSRIFDPRSTVLIMLATEEASMLPPGAKTDTLLGLNAPEYESFLAQVVRRPAIRLRFETRSIKEQDRWTPRVATAIVAVPRDLTGREGTVHRGQTTGTAVPKVEGIGGNRGGPGRWLIPVLPLVLVVAASILWKKTALIRRGHRVREIVLGDHIFGVQQASSSCEWRIFADGTSTTKDTDVVGTVLSGEPPREPLATVRYEARTGVTLDPGPVITTVSLDGTDNVGKVTLQPGPHHITLNGSTQVDPDLPPDRFIVELTAEVR